MRSCPSGRGGLGETRRTRRGRRVEATRRIRVGSWNVGSLTGKLLELVDVLERSQNARNEDGVILKACLKDKVVHVNRSSDRFISSTLVTEGETVNGAPDGPTTDSRGDLNGHRGEAKEQGGFDYGVRNEEGRSILDFAIAHDLAVVNSYFNNRDHHHPSSDNISERGRSDQEFTKGVSTQIEVISASDAESMWNILASIIKDAAKDSLCVAIGTLKTHTARREFWWLCEEVQSKVAVKQASLESYSRVGKVIKRNGLGRKRGIKRLRKKKEKVVAQAKEKAYEDLYKKLDSKE
ncbi:hypothetical protein Tco_0232727 [Tanacetum coccineum]